MPDEPTPTDEQLEALLKAGFEEFESVPEGFTDMVMTGWDIVNIDAAVAELVEDTALTGVEGIRSADLGARLLTFQADGFAFEFEIGPNAPEVVGHLEPPQPGVIAFEQGETVESTELDDLAQFEFALRGNAPFRLRHEPPDGPTTVTDWLIP